MTNIRQVIIIMMMVGGICTTANAQQVIKVGETVNINQYNLINVNNQQLNASKPIVIDFWATWCGPCIAAFPHLDALQNKYINSFQFIALSDEKQDRVNSFVKEHKYSFSYYLDPEKALFKLFEINARPLTCIIDTNNILLWVGDSKNLELVLESYLQNQSVDENIPTGALAAKYYQNTVTNTKAHNLLNYQLGFSVNPDDYFVRSQKGPRVDSAVNIEYRAVTVSELIQDMLELPALQFNNTLPILDTTYIDLIATSDNPNMTYRLVAEKIMQDLAVMFNFTITKQSKQVNVYELLVVDEKKLQEFENKIPGGGVVEKSGDSIIMTRLYLEQIASYLEKKYQLFITYNGSSETQYSLVFTSTPTIDEVIKQFENKFGLQLIPGTAVKQLVTLQ